MLEVCERHARRVRARGARARAVSTFRDVPPALFERALCRFKTLLREKIAEEVAARDPLWETYDAATKAEKTRSHEGDCWNHLRNVWFGGGAKAIAAKVKEGLVDDLANFASWERISTDISQLLRAVYKEFHEGGSDSASEGRLRVIKTDASIVVL